MFILISPLVWNYYVMHLISNTSMFILISPLVWNYYVMHLISKTSILYLSHLWFESILLCILLVIHLCLYLSHLWFDAILLCISLAIFIVFRILKFRIDRVKIGNIPKYFFFGYRHIFISIIPSYNLKMGRISKIYKKNVDSILIHLSWKRWYCCFLFD